MYIELSTGTQTLDPSRVIHRHTVCFCVLFSSPCFCAHTVTHFVARFECKLGVGVRVDTASLSLSLCVCVLLLFLVRLFCFFFVFGCCCCCLCCCLLCVGVCVCACARRERASRRICARCVQNVHNTNAHTRRRTR